MQSAKSGVSRVLGLPARLISVPKAYIRSCHVLTVTPDALDFLLSNPGFEKLVSIRLILKSYYQRLFSLSGHPLRKVKLSVELATHLGS